MKNDEKTTIEWDGVSIPPARWGQDHWSTLLYIETLIVDGRGDGYARPAVARMRQDSNRPRRGHGKDDPGLDSSKERYPTILLGGHEVLGHDDFDCLDDMEVEGVLIVDGTGAQPLIRLTDYGYTLVAALRRHRGQTGGSAGFAPTSRPPEAPVPAKRRPPAVGDVLDVDHTRKGSLVLRVTKLDKTWMTGTIVEGVARAMNPDNVREAGEEVTLRRSMITRQKRVLDKPASAP